MKPNSRLIVTGLVMAFSITSLTFSAETEAVREISVMRPDGQPAAHTTVYLCDNRKGVMLDTSGLPNMRFSQAETVQTDEQGRFKFTLRPDLSYLVVVAEEGFAQTPVGEVSETKVIQLLQWSRITGKLMIGHNPGIHESIALQIAEIPFVHGPTIRPALRLHYSTTTTPDGRFSFEKVPPMVDVMIYHSPRVRETGSGIIPMSQMQFIHPAPGEVVNVQLGGHGRPVIGRAVVKGRETVDWRQDAQHLELIRPNPEWLPNLNAMTREYSENSRAVLDRAKRQELYEAYQLRRSEAENQWKAFYQTKEGRAHAFSRRRYALNFKQDGTFRAEDVAPGDYTLTIRLGDMGPWAFGARRIVNFETNITVPPISAAAPADAPADVGTFEINARRSLSIGSQAPEFSTKALDGTPLKLTDYRGKFVLLDFWATWCGPCVAELPYLKETYERFSANDRFVMIGLSLDSNPKLPAEFAERNDLKWTQCYLGEWSKTDVPDKYGVDGIPATFLIGPDGTIVAKDIRGEQIPRAVARALDATPTQIDKNRTREQVRPPVVRVTENKIPTREELDRISELIKELSKLRTVDNTEVWAGQIRELVSMGGLAIPALIDAVDHCEHPGTLRYLGFALRAIGDPRAVPALIRAIPKGLTPPSSDFGLTVQDTELMRFMQTHSMTPERQGRHFTFGRPIREICSALQSITGHSENEAELFHIMLDGGQQQIRMRKHLYHQTAQRWAEWWRENQHRFLDDPGFANVNLPPLQSEVLSRRFPSGDHMKLGEIWSNVTIESVHAGGRKCFLDLDTNRFPERHERLDDLDPQQPNSFHSLTAWAAGEGIDIIGVDFRPANSDNIYYCLRGVGLQVWEVENARWDTISQELASGAPIALGRPAGDLLLHYDAERDRYAPEETATFLFATREGTRGILRVAMPLVRSADAENRYAAIRRDSSVMPVGSKIEYRLFADLETD